jgi:hypothetical protein
MKNEEQIKDRIDRLNSTWNNAFTVLQKLNPEHKDYEKVRDRYKTICIESMIEILGLKWVLEYNYLAPHHTLGYIHNE